VKKKLIIGVVIALAIMVGLVAVLYNYNSENNNLAVNTPPSSVSPVPSHTAKSYVENLTESIGAANP